MINTKFDRNNGNLKQHNKYRPTVQKGNIQAD